MSMFDKINGGRPALIRANQFLEYAKGYGEFKKFLKRKGQWTEFQKDVGKCINGQEIDIHFLKRAMEKWGYEEKFGLVQPHSEEYPEGWQFKGQYGHNPEMPPMLAFVWLNIPNVPDEFKQDPKATYESLKGAFLVHPFDAPDWGSWGMLLHYARNQEKFYDTMVQHAMYAPEAMAIFKPSPTESAKLLSQTEKTRKNVRKLANGKSVHEIQLMKGDQVTTDMDELKRIIEGATKHNVTAGSTKIRRRTATLPGPAKGPEGEGQTPSGNEGAGGKK